MLPSIPAGALPHHLAIQAKTEERDASGGVVETWTTAVYRWSRVEPLRGRELLEANKIDARLTHKITMRYYAGLTPSHRLLLGTRVFNALVPLTLEERKAIVELFAVEDV